MLFNSYIFIFAFLPISVLGYFAINKMKKHKLAKYFLLIMSLVFYGYFNIYYLAIILSSIFINFLGGVLLRNTEKEWIRKLELGILLLINIGILFYYKYFDFFIININSIFNQSFNLLNILLPLGISFFTFQQLSYIVDCYKDKKINYKFVDYALFVTFFPQLIAGPIVLHSETIPQFEDEKNQKINFENLSKGVYAFALGLGKKVLIADLFGRAVEIRIFRY